jgi:hypothetical protein
VAALDSCRNRRHARVRNESTGLSPQALFVAASRNPDHRGLQALSAHFSELQPCLPAFIPIYERIGQGNDPQLGQLVSAAPTAGLSGVPNPASELGPPAPQTGRRNILPIQSLALRPLPLYSVQFAEGRSSNNVPAFPSQPTTRDGMRLTARSGTAQALRLFREQRTP